MLGLFVGINFALNMKMRHKLCLYKILSFILMIFDESLKGEMENVYLSYSTWLILKDIGFHLLFRVTSLQESTFDMLLRGGWRNPENLSTLSLNIKWFQYFVSGFKGSGAQHHANSFGINSEYFSASLTNSKLQIMNYTMNLQYLMRWFQ